jgi:hypothetical protein
MAIAFDTRTQISPDWANTTSYTQAHTITGSNTLLIVSLFSRNVAASGITWGGTALTLLSSRALGGGDFTEVYYLVGAATGNKNVVVTYPSAANLAGGIASYTGVKQTGFPDASDFTQTPSGTNANYSASITSSANNCWGFLFANFTDGGSAGSGTTLDLPNGGTANTTLARTTSAKTPAGSITIQMSTTNRFAGPILWTVAPVAAATPTNASMLMMLG